MDFNIVYVRIWQRKWKPLYNLEAIKLLRVMGLRFVWDAPRAQRTFVTKRTFNSGSLVLLITVHGTLLKLLGGTPQADSTWGYIETMEKKMETTMMGYIYAYILG